MSAMARLVIDCSEDYHRKVVEAAKVRGMGYKQWIVRLIDREIRKGLKPEDKVPLKYQPTLRTMMEVLSSGDEMVADGLERGIEGFLALAAAVRKPRTDK